ncbi:Wzt carbohydrate-binding domain-containing protein, partial [bacterium]|nr:Wzt carbohydrate-binding domain-containing protein [bacterium]
RSVESDAGLIIEMDVQLIKQLSDFALAVAIFNESNVKCLEVNIPSIRSITDTWNGNSKFQCHIPNLPLLPGHYYANVGIYPPDWHCIYDYHWQMHPFRIVGDVPNVAGIVSVRPVWSKPRKDAKT